MSLRNSPSLKLAWLILSLLILDLLSGVMVARIILSDRDEVTRIAEIADRAAQNATYNRQVLDERTPKFHALDSVADFHTRQIRELGNCATDMKHELRLANTKLDTLLVRRD